MEKETSSALFPLSVNVLPGAVVDVSVGVKGVDPGPREVETGGDGVGSVCIFVMFYYNFVYVVCQDCLSTDNDDGTIYQLEDGYAIDKHYNIMGQGYSVLACYKCSLN